MSKSTWDASPPSSEWNSAKNWTPNSVPTEDAVFSKSDQTSVTFDTSKSVAVNSIEFTEDADAFNLTIGNSPDNTVLTINEGVQNNSEKQQVIEVASQGAHYQTPQMKFTGKANAGGDNMLYKSGPTSLEGGFGGGIIAFTDQATAGSASFVVRTGAKNPPEKNSTVGAEISFSDQSNAGRGTFTSYGTLQPVDGEKLDKDTFANIVFHDTTNAAQGTFISAGGTYGDGGNTQFYDSSHADHGTFVNHGGTMDGANGGDTVFDGTSNGANGNFTNHAATNANGFGGVVSFNNNKPPVDNGGSSAGNGIYHNLGASAEGHGGGGHIEFSAIFGSPTADHGTFHNYGSILSKGSTAGHSILSITLPTKYCPDGGFGNFWNYPAPVAGGSPGYTELAVYTSKYYNAAKDGTPENYPSAANATFHNLGATDKGAYGGFTKISSQCSAANATLIATAGTNGGYGGKIVFENASKGSNAHIQISGNGTLDISGHTGALTAKSLISGGGIVVVQTGDTPTTLELSGRLEMTSDKLTFQFPYKGGTFEYGKDYTLLTAQNLGDYSWEQFEWGYAEGFKAYFEVDENSLKVRFDEA